MVLCFVPFIVIFTVIFRKFSRRANRKLKNATTDINTYLSENLSGIKVTQIFGREDAKMRGLSPEEPGARPRNQEQIFVFSVFRPLVYMLYISSMLCLFYLGGKGYLNNVVPGADAYQRNHRQLLHVHFQVLHPHPEPGRAVQLAAVRAGIAEKVFSIMDIEPKMQDAPDAIELTDVRGEIEFRDVWFSYIPGEWVLQGVSFHVNPKETVAFVGSTGSGKSDDSSP